MRLFLFILLLLLLAGNLEGQQKKGLDTLGILGYSEQAISSLIKEIPADSCIGALLDRTFGDSWEPLERVFKSGKVSCARVHLLNTTAVRNANLQSEELLHGYTVASLNADACSKDKKLLKIVDGQLGKLGALAKKYPTITIYPSLFLEHNLDRSCAQAMLKYASRRYTLAKFVDSPMLKYSKLKNYINEKHGNTTKAEITSNDGVSVFDANNDVYIKNASLITLNWFHELNKRKTGEKSFITPRKRTFEPSRDQLAWAVTLLNAADKKPTKAPAVCKSFREPASPELWKTSAEDYGNGDRRGGRPMLISQSKLPFVPIVNNTGRQVGGLKYFGSYGGAKGYNRHYLGSGSGQTALGLRDDAGGEWVFLQLEKNVCLLVNSLRRSGSYR